MSSIVAAVFKATIGLLVDKGRDKAAEKLKEGDVTDQKFRGLIVREIEDIKSKLDGQARKDLLASISFFKEGIELMYVFFEKARSRSEHGAVTAQAATGTARTACAEAIYLAKGMRKLELTDLDESTTRTLCKAKKRFKDARREATKAFANEALELSNRLLAMEYRVMATILETVDHPEDALASIKVCIEELHCLSAVQKSFNVELKKGIRAWFSKDGRGKIISSVCHVNRVIFDVVQMVASWRERYVLPCVDTGEEKVDPLRDERIVQVLQKQGMEHCCVRWSFGQEGEEEHKLKDAWGFARNIHGQFIIADNGDKTLKMFDSNGGFHLSFNPQTDDAHTELDILDVAIDVKNKTYVLVRLDKPGTMGNEWEVWVYNGIADLLHKFPVKGWYWGRLTVSGSKVLVLSDSDEYVDDMFVDVYEQSGKFLCTFGVSFVLLTSVDITAANDGRVMVVDCDDSIVHLFTVEGQHLNKFNINIEGDDYYRIACHPAGEHVVVAGHERGTFRLRVAIFTTTGELVRRIQLNEEKVYKMRGIAGITVTTEGHIVVITDKIIVV